jgi:hypothetical protein
MKILLDFSAKVVREYIFEPTVGNESLHENNNVNGVRAVNFATSRNPVVKRTCSHIPTFINTLGLQLIGQHTIRVIPS